MKAQFFSLAARLEQNLAGGETLLCNVSAERSDFVRFNKALVRQAGSVKQRYLTLRLLNNRRQASATLALAGSDDDLAHAREALATLRELPEDPWRLINQSPQSSDAERRGRLAPSARLPGALVSGVRWPASLYALLLADAVHRHDPGEALVHAERAPDLARAGGRRRALGTEIITALTRIPNCYL